MCTLPSRLLLSCHTYCGSIPSELHSCLLFVSGYGFQHRLCLVYTRKAKSSVSMYWKWCLLHLRYQARLNRSPFVCLKLLHEAAGLCLLCSSCSSLSLDLFQSGVALVQHTASLVLRSTHVVYFNPSSAIFAGVKADNQRSKCGQLPHYRSKIHRWPSS